MRLTTYLAVLTLWGTAALPSVALAQKPVLTQNVDEPGRNPYQSVVQLNNSRSCGNLTPASCFVSFTPVPAGKRLVVTYASARFRADSEQTYKSVAIQPFHFRTFLPAPSLIGSDFYIAAGPISSYFEEDETPQMLIEGISLSSPAIEAALVGYLVSVQ